jgi:putative aldouronate transport system substrate-binding protein
MKKIGMALVILAAAVSLAFVGCNRGTTSSGPARLSVEVFDRGTDGGRSLAHDNAWTNWIKEKVLQDLNIEVTFIPVGRWSEDTDIVNLMASGSAPDLCYTYNTGMINSFRDQGGILNLAPYIDSHLSDMKRLLGSDPAIQGQDLIYRDRDPATGAIYSVPSYVVRLAQRNTFIRKDWLDALGLPLPRTTQEFYNALVAFRDRDPGNVGRNRVIPFGQGSDVRWGLANIVHTFFDLSISDREMWIARFSDRPITVPGYKEGVRLMNRWYNEGLIFRDFPLMTVADDMNNILKSGVVGAFSGNWDLPWRTDYKINEELAINVPGAEFVAVDPFQASDGTTRKDISDKPGLRIFIPASSRNHDAALRYLNWLCKFENFNFLQIGFEGVNHEIVNGVPRVLTTPPGHQWFQNSQYNIDFTIPMNGLELLDAEKNARVTALGYGNTPAEVIVNAFNLSTVNGRAPPVYQAVTTRDGIYGQTLRDKADALLSQSIIARPQDFDRVWDDGMRDYLASGAQEIMDERASLWR